MKIQFKEEDDIAIELWASQNQSTVNAVEKIVLDYIADSVNRETTVEARIASFAKKDITEVSISILVTLLSMQIGVSLPLISKMGELAGKIRVADTNEERLNSFTTAGELLLLLCKFNLARLTTTYNGTYMIETVVEDNELAIKYLSSLPLSEPTNKHMALGKYNWDITNPQALDKLNNIAFTLLPFTEKEPLDVDDEQHKKYLMRKHICSAMIGKKFYFNWHADHRYRLYSGGYYLAPQGSEFEKSILAFAEGEYLNKDGVRALKLATANAFGLDKLTYKEKYEWFDKNERMLIYMQNKAKEPHTFKKMLTAWNQHYNGKKVNIPIGFDATNSQLQMIACLTGDLQTAKICNIINETDKREDAYKLTADVMSLLSNGKLKFTRDHLKKSSMIDGYGAGKALVTEQMMEDMGDLFTDEAVNIFYKAQDLVSPAASRIKETFMSIWDSSAELITWSYPNGHTVQHRPMSSVEVTFELFDGFKVPGNIQLNIPTSKSTSLGVSVIHGTDGYVADRMIVETDFDLYTVHDEFICHPNNMFKAQALYREIMGDITDSRMLEDIITEITGEHMPSIKKEFTGKDVVEKSIYSIC